jgi:hypothetical protein
MVLHDTHRHLLRQQSARSVYNELARKNTGVMG